MEFEYIVQDYLYLIDNAIEHMERDSLSLLDEEFDEAQDSIIAFKAHRAQTRSLLKAMKETS